MASWWFPQPWSERARLELRALGFDSPPRSTGAWEELSPQELEVAQLAAPAYAFFWVQPQGTLVPIRELRSDVQLFNLVAVPQSKRDRVVA